MPRQDSIRAGQHQLLTVKSELVPRIVSGRKAMNIRADGILARHSMNGRYELNVWLNSLQAWPWTKCEKYGRPGTRGVILLEPRNQRMEARLWGRVRKTWHARNVASPTVCAPSDDSLLSTQQIGVVI